MAYTPELSQIGSATLRRLAWYMKIPMTKSLEMVIEFMAIKIAESKPGEICSRCRDDSICEKCPFNPRLTLSIRGGAKRRPLHAVVSLHDDHSACDLVSCGCIGLATAQVR